MLYAIIFLFGILVYLMLFKYKNNDKNPYSKIYLKNSLKINGVKSFFEKHEIVLKNGLPNIVKIYNCFPQEYYFNPPKIMKTVTYYLYFCK
jgi:hypothetical protein